MTNDRARDGIDYRRAILAAPFGCGVTTPDGRWVEVNAALCRMLGHTEAELLALDFRQVTHPDDLAADLAQVQRLAAGEVERFEIEKRYLRKDGRQIWVRLQLSAVRDAQGQVQHFISLVDDITERRAADQAVSESRQRAQLAMEATGVGQYEWNLHAGEARWDAQMFRIYGMAATSDGLASYDIWRSALAPDEVAEQEALLGELVQQRRDRIRRRFTIRRVSDGARRVIESVDTLRLDASGQAAWVVGTNWDVTDRLALDDELRHRSQRLRTLLDAFPFFVWLKDRDSRLLAANQEYARVARVASPAELEGRTDHDFFPADLADKYMADDRDVMAGGTPRHVEEMYVDETGARRWMETWKGPLVVDGQVSGTVGFSRDITARMEADNRIRELQQEYAHLFSQSPDGLVVVDPADGRILDGNPAALALIRGTREQLLGCSVLDIAPEHQPDGRPSIEVGLQHIRDAVTQGQSRFEFTYRRFDGSTFVAEVGVARCVYQGRPMLLGTWRDATARREAELSTQRLAAIVTSSADAIIGKDLHGRIVSWNAAAEQLFGYRPDEVMGRTLTLLLPRDPEAIQLQRDAERRVLAGEAVPPMETVRRCKDGRSVDVSVRMSPIRDAAGRMAGASVVVRDITEARQRDAELRRSNAELEQFAYVASHDLQEPLRMVASYTELLALRYQGKLDERADKYIRYASDGARRMQRLVADLLAFSRVGSQGQPLVPVSADAALRTALELLAMSIAQAQAQVHADPLPQVLADEDQLVQLLQNLVGNAIKYRSDSAPQIQVRAQPAGRRWLFSVQDNGIGIDMRYAERIFQMFQRLHAVGQYEGSGIGLAIAKRIVDRHGGKLWVESAPGAGSTFFFTLHAAEEAA